MAYNTNQTMLTGSYIPTTYIWDIAQLQEVDLSSPEFRELLVRLYQNLNSMALVLNIKDTGYYLTQPFATSKSYSSPSATSTSASTLIPSYREFFIIGALGPGVTTVAHGLPITSSWRFISIIGAASDTVGFNYYPIPSAGTSSNSIQVTANATDIFIDNESGISFTDAYVTLEWVQF